MPSKEIGQCAHCRDIIHSDDSGAIEIYGELFCSVECAGEVVPHEIKTGFLTIASRDADGNPDYEYKCPYCGKVNAQDEGSSVIMENGRCITTCVKCGNESICEERKKPEKEDLGTGSDSDEKQKVPIRCLNCCALSEQDSQKGAYYCDCGRDGDGYEYDDEGDDLTGRIVTCGTRDLARIVVNKSGTEYELVTLETSADADFKSVRKATVADPRSIVDLLNEINGMNYDVEIFEVD
jgi:hypothetical protein